MSRHPFQVATIIVGLALTLLSLARPGLHPASVSSIVSFHLVFAVLIFLVPIAPRSHAYTAFSAMLVLGFWTKFVVRLAVHYPYMEPIGLFDGSGPVWDHALNTITVAVSGVIAIRMTHLLYARARPRSGTGLDFPSPALYAAHRTVIWSVTGAIVALVYAWNTYAAVYVTGIDPRVVLPLKGNAILSWCFVLGLPLWLSVLLGWELGLQQTRTLSTGMLLVPIAEAIVNAGSLLSRATYLLRVVPYFLATTRTEGSARVAFRGAMRPVLLLVLAGFIGSLGSVMALRTVTYYRQPAPSAAQATERAGAGASTRSDTPPVAVARPATTPEPGVATRPVFFAIREVGTLFVDRWTGMEGVLAVTSWPLYPGLLTDVLREDPATGTESIYQKIAGSTYRPKAGFTFLTLAGIVAVLALSGSALFVWAGMAVAAALLMGTEGLVRRWLRNELSCAVVSVGATFPLVQLNFPRLLAAFFIELWVAIAILAFVQYLMAGVTSRRGH